MSSSKPAQHQVSRRQTSTARVRKLVLESGEALTDVPVAYRTWGALNEAGDNALLVCHALTANADVEAWWGALLGPGRALDTERYFVICANALGSPYGTASALTTNPATDRPYGADFPRVTIRDTVALHRQLLRQLGVRRLAAVVGPSTGGMQALEWAFDTNVVQAFVLIAAGGQRAAWQIGWSEAQRQAIYADPNWQGGRYAPERPPRQGLSAARMMAMLSYRSYASYADRFGRDLAAGNGCAKDHPHFAVESYLRYQGEKLAGRFDANCYVRLTQQADAHDVARGRGAYPGVLRAVKQPALVVGIDSDVLYPPREQEELAEALPRGDLQVLSSSHGHDAFLIEQEALDGLLRPWLLRHAEVRSARAS